MESKDRIPQNFDVLDLSRAMNSFKREQIRKILELPDHQSFSVVRWYSPAILGARSIEGQAAGNRSCVGLVLSAPG